VKLDRSRIISRLRSELWEPPDAFKTRPPSLCACLHRMLQAVSRASPGRRTDLEPISRNVRSLSSLVAVADGGGFSGIHENLKGVLRAAGNLTGSDVSLELFLDRKTIRTTDMNQKAIRAFDKLANYWRLCRRLCRLAASKQYRSFFAPLYFEFLKNYSKHKINGINRYVHAEVQLAIFHRQRKDSPDPRAIGTSKAACYLCNLFLSYHPQHTISATHGVLYECWTIPDLTSYNVDDRRELRNIIDAMFKKLTIWTSFQSHPHTMFPVQSGIYQPPYVPSLTATTTSFSDATIKENSPEAPTYSGVDDGHVYKSELEEQNAPSHAPCQSQTNTDIAPGPSATQPNVAGSDAAGSTEAQRLHSASEQREVPEGTDGGPSAPTVARNAPERTGFPDALKPTKIKAQGHVAGSAPDTLRMPVAAPIEAGDIAGYLGGVSKRDVKQQIREGSRRKSHRTQSGQYILQGQKVLRIRRSDDNRGTVERKSRRQKKDSNRKRKRKRRTTHHDQRQKSPRPRLLRILDHILAAFCGLHRH